MDATHIEFYTVTPGGVYAASGWPTINRAERVTTADWTAYVRDQAQLLGDDREGYACHARDNRGQIIASHVFA